MATVSKYANRRLHLRVNSDQKRTRALSREEREKKPLGLSLRETERVFFVLEETALWFCSYDAVALGSDGSLTGDWYIHVENEFGCIWRGEPSPAESTDTAAEKTTSCESVSTVLSLYGYERVSGGGRGLAVGWVLKSWNNTFLLESITQKVKILLVSSFKWYFSPQSMLPTGCMSWNLKKTKNQMLLCTLSSGCVNFLYRTTWFSCLYMFVLLHAVKSNYRTMHTGISLYYGSKCAARPSQTNDIRTILCMSSYGKGGGVSMTWGYLLPL